MAKLWGGFEGLMLNKARGLSHVELHLDSQSTPQLGHVRTITLIHYVNLRAPHT
jgi:hypothetical protein